MRRARKIRVRAYDLEGNLVEHDADDLFSRAVQHETDHLDGKLFIDYLEPAGPAIGRGEDPRVRAGLPPGASGAARSRRTTSSSQRLDEITHPTPDVGAVDSNGHGRLIE